MLSPSLQSYLSATDPSWTGGPRSSDSGGGGGGWVPSPQRQRDPTAIYREEIARIGRRFGLNTRDSGSRNARTNSRGVDRRSARSAALPHHQRVGAPSAGSYYTRLSQDGTFLQDSKSKSRKRQGVVPHRGYQVEGFLEQGLDGGVALTGSRHLGRRNGRRSIGPAPHSTEDARYFFVLAERSDSPMY